MASFSTETPFSGLSVCFWIILGAQKFSQYELLGKLPILLGLKRVCLAQREMEIWGLRPQLNRPRVHVGTSPSKWFRFSETRPLPIKITTWFTSTQYTLQDLNISNHVVLQVNLRQKVIINEEVKVFVECELRDQHNALKFLRFSRRIVNLDDFL